MLVYCWRVKKAYHLPQEKFVQNRGGLWNLNWCSDLLNTTLRSVSNQLLSATEEVHSFCSLVRSGRKVGGKQRSPEKGIGGRQRPLFTLLSTPLLVRTTHSELRSFVSVPHTSRERSHPYSIQPFLTFRLSEGHFSLSERPARAGYERIQWQ